MWLSPLWLADVNSICHIFSFIVSVRDKLQDRFLCLSHKNLTVQSKKHLFLSTSRTRTADGELSPQAARGQSATQAAKIGFSRRMSERTKWARGEKIRGRERTRKTKSVESVFCFVPSVGLCHSKIVLTDRPTKLSLWAPFFLVNDACSQSVCNAWIVD